MSNLSQFRNNGQTLQVNAGSAAINVGDLLEIGGPGSQAYTAATIDYSISAPVSTLITQTSLSTYALAGSNRIQLARDRLGNIYEVGSNGSGNLVIYKFGPTANTTSSAILDSTATTVNTPRLFQLQNGNYCCVYARSAGALYFVIFDAALNVVAGPTSVATEYASTNVVYHDAIALTGGGFAIAYQTSAGTAINGITYSNVGAVVTAAMSIQALVTAAQEFIKIIQLSSGNLVVAYRGTMTISSVAGTYFNIVSATLAAVAGPTSVDTTASLGFLELNQLSGFFSIATALLHKSVYRAN